MEKPTPDEPNAAESPDTTANGWAGPSPIPAPRTATRPFALTLLAVLSALAGLLAGLATLAFFMSIGANPILNSGVGGGVAVVLAAFTLAETIADFLFAFGAWALRPWGWRVGVAAQILTLVFGAILFVLRLGLPIGNIISALIILAYLFMSDIRSDFERE
jgi:hypothetical protein